MEKQSQMLGNFLFLFINYLKNGKLFLPGVKAPRNPQVMIAWHDQDDRNYAVDLLLQFAFGAEGIR